MEIVVNKLKGEDRFEEKGEAPYNSFF